MVMKYLKVGADGHRHSAAGGAGARQGGASCHDEDRQDHFVVQLYRGKEGEDLVQVWTEVAMSRCFKHKNFFRAGAI